MTKKKHKKCKCRIPLYVTMYETKCLNCKGDITYRYNDHLKK